MLMLLTYVANSIFQKSLIFLVDWKKQQKKYFKYLNCLLQTKLVTYYIYSLDLYKLFLFLSFKTVSATS